MGILAPHRRCPVAMLASLLAHLPQVGTIVLVAIGLVGVLCRHQVATTQHQWLMAGGVALASVVWLATLAVFFRSFLGFFPVMGMTLIPGVA